MKLFEERHGLPIGTVRVVSCHYFQAQNVFLSDHDPVSLCVASEKLLIASDQHSVEVHSLEESGKFSHSFPTVDLVQEIIHCKTGNYIACLELKTSRQSIPVHYARVYLNWWMPNRDQVMKARIAGKVTPSCQPGNATLEMVEIPLKQCADKICCCQESGNIAISFGNTIAIHIFSVKTHDISKIKFIDFNHLVSTQLSFRIQQIAMCEDFVACGNKKELQVFRICVNQESVPRKRSYAFIGIEQVENKEKQSVALPEDMDCNKVDDSDCIAWDFNGALHGEGNPDLGDKIGTGSWPLTVHLKSLSDDNNFVDDGREGMEIRGLTYGNIPAHPLKAELDPMFMSADQNVYREVNIISLLYKRISSSTLVEEMETNTMHSITFLSVYKSDDVKNTEQCINGVPSNGDFTWNKKLDFPLCSPINDSLSQVCFFVSTPNDGYLYDLTDDNIPLACQYQYTSICKSVIVDVSTLHALTEAGLETYTGRIAHCVMHNQCKNDDKEVSLYPKRDDPVCLLDLRPFLNIDYILKSNNQVILISGKDLGSSTESITGGEATVYSLQKPAAKLIYDNLIELADGMKDSSKCAYQHLLTEAGMVLKGHLLQVNKTECYELFQQWCFLLANYYLSSSNNDENVNCLPYLTMSNLPLKYILNKIIKSKNSSKTALIKYLKYVLLSESYQDEVYALPQSIGDTILEFFEEAECGYISSLILSSHLHYKIDKAIKIMRKQIAEKKNVAKDAVAITVLLLKKGNKDSVQSVLNSLPKDKMYHVLKMHIDLLFLNHECKQFSAYGHVLAVHKPEVLAMLLYRLSCKSNFSLIQVIDIIQSQSSESSKSNISLLQSLAEFILFEASDSKSVSDQAILIDLLAAIYVESILKDERETSILSQIKSQFTKRHQYLNFLPPFQGNIVQKTCQLELKNESECYCMLCHGFLLKLQILLCGNYAHQVDKVKILEMLECGMKGYLSIQLLCAKSFNDALKLIQEHNDFSVLLQYGIDMFNYDLEKWNVLYNIVLNKRFETGENEDDYENLNCTILEILRHLSEHVSPNNLVQFIPAGMDQHLYLPLLKKSCDKHLANKMKAKIVSMASDLKKMM